MNKNTFPKAGKVLGGLLLALSMAWAMNSYAGTICLTACPPEITPASQLVPSGGSIPPLGEVGLLQLIPTQGTAGWQYAFSTSDLVSSVTLPLFSDSQLSAITATTGWSLGTGSTDLFGLGGGVGYMNWSHVGTGPASTFPSFSFLSSYGPALSTYQFVLSDGTTVSSAGFVPASPLALAAGLQPYTAAVPEPRTGALMMAGLGAILIAARRRRPTHANWRACKAMA